MKVLKQKNTLGKFMANAEAYLEPRQTSKMELFGLTIFAKKFHHRFSIGFQIRLGNGNGFFKNSNNISGKKLSWSTVLVKL